MVHIPDWAPLVSVKANGGGSVLLVVCQDCGSVSAEGDAWTRHADWHRSHAGGPGDASAVPHPFRMW